jgi:hypothetical protein
VRPYQADNPLHIPIFNASLFADQAARSAAADQALRELTAAAAAEESFSSASTGLSSRSPSADLASRSVSADLSPRSNSSNHSSRNLTAYFSSRSVSAGFRVPPKASPPAAAAADPSTSSREGALCVSLTVPASHAEGAETRLALRSVGYCGTPSQTLPATSSTRISYDILSFLE